MKTILIIFVLSSQLSLAETYNVCKSVQITITCPQIYYIDASQGDDTNSGKDETKPWMTLSRINSQLLNPGDSVLLKRGEVWRELLVPQSGNSNGYITFGAYGDPEKEKPTIMWAKRMMNQAEWTQKSANIWTAPFSSDIGNIVFNGESLVGVKVWTEADLTAQGKYWFDKPNGLLHLYSAVNPAIYYTDIECIKGANLISVKNKSYIIFKELALRYGGEHGFFVNNSNHISIIDNDISWIGGSKPAWSTYDQRLGNGIELYDGAEDILVERNRIWQVYDACLTTQSDSIAAVKNITFQNNLVWKCGYSFEFWHKNKETILDNIRFDHNTSLYAGYEWSHKQRVNDGGYDFAYFGSYPSPTGLRMRNNIFYKSYSDSAHIYYSDSNLDAQWENVELDYNVWWRVPKNATTDGVIIYWKAKAWYWSTNWPAWQSATYGKDKHSVAAEPLFVNLPEPDLIDGPKSFDARLKDGSPGVGMGIVTETKNDIDGKLRREKIIVGAYQ